MRFTDRSIDALKPKPDRYEKKEDGRTGLWIRVTPRNVKTFSYIYRVRGNPKSRRLTLGQYAKPPAIGISLATARRMMGEAREKLDAGIDPGAEVVEERRIERAAETVSELVVLYLEIWARPRKRSAAEDERILYKDVVPIWGARKIGTIRKRDVVLLLDNIVNRGAPISAIRTLSLIRKVFNFALSRDLAGLTVNPCNGVDAPAPEGERTRYLTDTEIITFWTGLDDERTNIPKPLRLALRLLLVTAVRRSEVAHAAWNEFDLGGRIWAIPSARTKNGKEHLVPLSALALSILEEMQVLAEASKKDAGNWLLPSPRGDRPLHPVNINHALTRNLPLIGLEDVTPHDLRRTAATLMGRLKVSRFVISRCLNHVDRTVTGRYDVHEYYDEKKDALDRLGNHLEALLAAGSADNLVILGAENR